MGNFGYFSPSLFPGTVWKSWRNWLPEKWRYRKGPVFAGRLDGQFGEVFLQGWGWQIPDNSLRVWNESLNDQIWQRMRDELVDREIKVIGVDDNHSQAQIPCFTTPGVSDGKTLELVMFMLDFLNMLHRKRLTRNSEILIVWEDGNLGLTCSRLIAREIRFLTLVHPSLATLEQAAAVIMAETGISSKIFNKLPANLGKIPVVIQCGRLKNIEWPANTRPKLWVKLFQNNSQWGSVLPVSVSGSRGKLPENPVLAETLIRAAGGMEADFWFGSTLVLERFIMLARWLKEFKIAAVPDNWLT